jgi:uncharacterized membrane protein YraQ (UPF0718 family)
MSWRTEWKKLAAIAVVFLVFFWLPVGWGRFTGGIMEALHLTKWYAREHVLLCLIPAFFIAGAIGVFISQASVMKYLGARANKVLAYGVASVSGSILAVCSCTVLPLFAEIWRMGAGLGPATAFLYSGPAINVLAIILTARILGLELGIARAVGAIGFSIIIGLIMHLIYRKEEMEKATGQMSMPEPEVTRPLWKNAVFFAVMVAVLVFANWGSPNDFQFRTVEGAEFTAAVLKEPEFAGQEYLLKYTNGPHAGEQIQVAPASIVLKEPVRSTWTTIWQNKWLVTAGFSAAFGLILIFWIGVRWWKVVLAAIPPALLALALPTQGLWILLPFSAGILGVSVALASSKREGAEWFGATWTFAKQILPLLFFGVLVAGFLLGRPDHEGLIPSKYVEMLVGDSPNRMLEITGWSAGGFENVARAIWPLWTNFFASIFGAFMYFATLTEVPILQGLIGSGMGKGPALALLLAGPALSLPNMLVIRSIMGTGKTVVFVSLVVVMSTITGMIFGAFF